MIENVNTIFFLKAELHGGLSSSFQHKATCILNFVQRQLPCFGFSWRYRHILFGSQTRIFHFSIFSVSHESLSFITLL